MGTAVTNRERVASLDFPGFAQEFLRRDPSYRRDYAALGSCTAEVLQGKRCREMARNWGLTFPN